MTSRRKGTPAPAQSIGAEIKRRREAQGLTFAALAADAGVHAHYVAKVERGEANVCLGVLRKLAAALGCQVGELFGPPPKLSEKALAFGRQFDAASPAMQAAVLALLRCLEAERRSQ